MFPARKPPSVTPENIMVRMLKAMNPVSEPQPVKPKKVCGEWQEVALASDNYSTSDRVACQRPLGHSGAHRVRIEWEEK